MTPMQSLARQKELLEKPTTELFSALEKWLEAYKLLGDAWRWGCYNDHLLWHLRESLESQIESLKKLKEGLS